MASSSYGALKSMTVTNTKWQSSSGHIKQYIIQTSLLVRTWKPVQRQAQSIYTAYGNRNVNLNQHNAKLHTRQRALVQLDMQHWLFLSHTAGYITEDPTQFHPGVWLLSAVTVPADTEMVYDLHDDIWRGQSIAIKVTLSTQQSCYKLAAYSSSTFCSCL
jgi:hypothetical protein